MTIPSLSYLQHFDYCQRGYELYTAWQDELERDEHSEAAHDAYTAWRTHAEHCPICGGE